MASATKIQLVMDIIDGALYDKSNPWNGAFGRVEVLTGLSRLKVLMCVILLTSVLIVYGTSAEVVSNAIGLVYPAVATISLTVSPPMSRKYERVSAATEALNEKFTYWMTFTAILILESLCRPVLRLLPLYQMCRTWFFIWCFAPIRDNGSAYIYDAIIRPQFEHSVDSD
ncbi:receptor expression-enhancing protein 5-like [Acyrthosiphon pisum]|uniref:Receptor expression-enhancing protein n=1 Tax=Acyrthosiphon pisum TaxID=7029 RepID=A0A8R2FD16_ACYPI|nr:receptor expression-enhancing protein 5-like [Acyrthosiphon pisum]|eukprot:XP_008189637.1 PREDICTED: receptor expression-enhancing protein 5-like [Acyrthosiphon pisum]